MNLSDSDKELLEAFDTIIRSSNPEVQKMLRNLVLLAQLSGDARAEGEVGPFHEMMRSYQRLEEQNKRLQRDVSEIAHVVKSMRGERYKWDEYSSDYNMRAPVKSNSPYYKLLSIDDDLNDLDKTIDSTIKQLKQFETKKKGFW